MRLLVSKIAQRHESILGQLGDRASVGYRERHQAREQDAGGGRRHPA